jgi:hypothetical protein
MASRKLRRENWVLNNNLRAAEKRIILLEYLTGTMRQRKSGQLPTEVEARALKILNQELIKRIQKVENLTTLNGKKGEKQETETNKESYQTGDGLYVERRESDAEE